MFRKIVVAIVIEMNIVGMNNKIMMCNLIKIFNMNKDSGDNDNNR